MSVVVSLSFAPSATFGSRGGLGGSRPAAAVKRGRRLPRIQCHAGEQSQSPSTTLRRSGNYQPSIWTHDRIQSLTLSHTADEEDHAERIKLLKHQTSRLMEEKKGRVEEQLQLIDHLQQLGVAYHFKDEIKDTLRGFHASFEDISLHLDDNLHASALLFRLLRENGFSVSDDIFKKFKDEKGQFEDKLKSQAEGLLSLYEASYFEKDGEELLHEAREFATKHLKSLLGDQEGSLKPGLIKEQVAHALELPLNGRFQRLHTKWFIGACRRQRDAAMDPALLELAKLDFNALQNIYKRELSEVSRWWTDLGLPKKLTFFRDRLTENYLWTVGFAMEPDSWAFRELQTKTNSFVTMIDDVYDVYGTLDELELFTDVMERWDVNTIDKLPEYMKLCFLAVFNTVNDAGYKVMRDKGVDIIPHLKRAWAELCKIYMREARWYHAGYTPTLDEYLDVAWISISGPLILSTAYCMGKDLTKEDLDKFSIYPSIVHPSSVLFRLHDDFGTSTDELARGDVQKAVQCFMHERKVGEAVAREHIERVMEEKWRRNGEMEEKWRNGAYRAYRAYRSRNIFRMWQLISLEQRNSSMAKEMDTPNRMERLRNKSCPC